MIADLEQQSIERQAEKRSAAFATLARKLSGASVPLDAAKIIVDTADQLFGWDSCTVYLYDSDRDLLQPVVRIDTIDGRRVDATSLSTECKPTPRMRRLIERSAGLTLREEPCAFDEDSVPFGDMTRPSAAIMDVLIRHASETIGTLSLQSYTPRSYDQNALNNLQALAEHCGEALNRIRAEQALRESEERYRDLVENSREFICTHDLNGIILSANRAASEVLGYDLKDYCGKKNYRDLLVPEVRDQFDDYLARIRRDGVASGLTLVQTSSGERRVLEYHNTLRTEGVAAPIVRGMARDVTEQRRAEKAMFILRRELELTMNSMEEGVHRVDLKGNIDFENPAAARMLGWEVDELLGKPAHLTMHHTRQDGTTYPREECPIYATLRDGVSRQVADEVFWRRNGTSFPVEYMTAPMRNDRNDIVAAVVTFRDITERKRAEESLNVFRTLIDQSNDAIEVIDPKTFRFLDCNQSAYQSLGYTREEFLTLTVFDIDSLVNAETIARFDEEMSKCGSATRESIHRRKDGSTFPVELNVKLVRLERDYRLAVVRDITGRKRAEEAVRDAEQKYRDIFENAGEGIFQTTREGRFLTANPALARMLGYDSAEDLILKRIDIEHQHYVDPLRRREFKRLVEENGFLRNFEYEAYRKDGSKLWITNNVRVVRDEDGTLLYYEGTAQDITERKQAEEALRLSERRYRQIVETACEGIWQIDAESRTTFVNQRMADLLGWTVPEMHGASMFEFMDEEGKAIAAANVERRQRGIKEQHDFKFRRKDGSDLWAIVSTDPIVDSAGRYAGALGLITDITERKRAEDALRESEERYRELFEQASDMIYTTDESGIWLALNPAALRLLKYAEEELLGQSQFDLIRPDYREPFREFYRRQYLGRIPNTFYSFPVIAKDGTEIWLEQNSTLLFENDRVAGFHFVARNITARKHAGEALREAEEKYRELFENAKDATYVHDLTGRYTSVNPAAEALSGYPCDEILGKHYTEFIAPEYLGAAQDSLCRKLKEEGETSYETEVITRDGRRVPVEINSRLIRKHGEVVGVQGIARDITERKRVELERDVISEVIQSVNLTSNLDELLTQAHESLKRVLYAENCCVVLHNKETGLFEAELFVDLVEANPFPIALSKNCTAKVFSSGQPLLMNETILAELLDRGEVELIGRPAPSFLAVPLMTPAETIGVIVVQHYEKENVYSQRDVGFLSAVAAQLALAIERKRAEEALRDAEQKYRELFENAKDATYVHDLTGRYTSVNPAAEALSGYPRDEILGKHFTGFIAPEYLGPAQDNLCRKLKEAGETTYEAEVITGDGRRVPVEINSRLIRKHGEVVAVQGTARDITERKRAQEAMRSYSRQLIEAQETERQNIARELHDEIGQVLTAVRINLQSAQRSSGTETYLLRIEDSIVVVDEALQRVRELSLQLRPALLDDLGLTAALRWYADRYALRTGFTVQILSDCETIRLRRELETACFRITQEALTNIARYTEATHILVELKRTMDMLTLVIKDDGPGFDVVALFRNASAGAALGLRGMEERALAAEGSFEINSVPGQGTEVRVTFPLTRKG